jgi:hypothetical protein
VADVIQIIHELFEGIVNAGTVGIVDLRPASDAWPHEMSEVVIGNDLFVLFDAFDPLGARPDEAHFAAEHVPELGKLV